MRRPLKTLLLAGTHALALGAGFMLGIYFLPILIAPEAPSVEAVQSTAAVAEFSGEFRRDLTDSDAFHWGEGRVYVSADSIALEGRLSPGPDYRLYLSPEFVDTETAFNELKAEMVQVGLVQTFDNFMVAVPPTIDPSQYKAVIVWCESFGEFITAAAYQ